MAGGGRFACRPGSGLLAAAASGNTQASRGWIGAPSPFCKGGGATGAPRQTGNPLLHVCVAAAARVWCGRRAACMRGHLADPPVRVLPAGEAPAVHNPTANAAAMQQKGTGCWLEAPGVAPQVVMCCPSSGLLQHHTAQDRRRSNSSCTQPCQPPIPIRGREEVLWCWWGRNGCICCHPLLCLLVPAPSACLCRWGREGPQQQCVFVMAGELVAALCGSALGR